MDEQIKRITERNHPELFARLHLPILGRVEAISDPMRVHALGERFRPRYAVDVTVLKPDGQPDDLVPLFRAVPLPLSNWPLPTACQTGHLSARYWPKG